MKVDNPHNGLKVFKNLQFLKEKKNTFFKIENFFSETLIFVFEVGNFATIPSTYLYYYSIFISRWKPIDKVNRD